MSENRIFLVTLAEEGRGAGCQVAQEDRKEEELPTGTLLNGEGQVNTMSQQEFEPRGRHPEDEIYKPHYPYNWSEQGAEGMPRDELPGNVQMPGTQDSYHYHQPRQAQVPWWARPQPQRNGTRTFAVIVAFAILITLLMGALGIMGVILGSLAHLIGILLGAIFALLIFVFLIVSIVLALIWRALGRAFGYDRRARRMGRRAARRYW